jgi:hypothetical protein
VPVVYIRDDDSRRITVELAGDVSLEELIAVVDRQAVEGTWSYGLLYDARRVSTAAESREARRLVAHVATVAAVHGQRGPVAIVTDRPATYGIVRMYSMLSDGAPQHLSVDVFRDPADAVRWLDRCGS